MSGERPFRSGLYARKSRRVLFRGDGRPRRRSSTLGSGCERSARFFRARTSGCVASNPASPRSRFPTSSLSTLCTAARPAAWSSRVLLLSTDECCARSPLVPRWTADAFPPSRGHPSLAVMPGSCALPTPPCRLRAAAALACAAAALPSRRALCSSRGRVSRSVVRFRRVSYTFGTRDGDTAPHAPADGRSSFNSLGRSLPALPLGVCGRAARQRAQGGAADERAAGARAAGGESAIAWSRGASLMRRCWTYAESPLG